MAALTIALLGTPHAEVQLAANAMNSALQISGWNAALVLSCSTPANLPDLAMLDLVLLVGLQPSSQCVIEDTGLAREAEHLSIRARLALANVPYRVLYGTGEERLAHALHAIERLLPRLESKPDESRFSNSLKKQPWVWMCDKCSDPQCEHKLLTALLKQRVART